jgi:four helix bundle protein
MLAYRKLNVHELALDIAGRVLTLLEEPAMSRRFWFCNQLGDAVGSISSNIAEGNGRSTPLDYASYLDRARGSAFEVDNWLLLAARQGWCSVQAQESLSNDLDRVSAMLYRLAAQLRRKASLESRTNPLR